MKILRIFALILVLTLCFTIAKAVERPNRFQKPEDAVAWLYRDFGWQAFVGRYFDDIINDQPRNVLQRYFTPRLTGLIIKGRRLR